MIKFCTCTGRLSSSSPHSLNKNTDISMTCKLNNMGLELPRPIDLDVKWKTVNRRQRATRRARTYFGEDTSRDGIGSFYLFGCGTNQEMAQDAPVSESEKFGVSILGRCFSDPMENVPIKKRRFHMDCSPSPPPTPLLVDPYEKILGSSSKAVKSYEKHYYKHKMQGNEYKVENKGRFGADDFSGIDILASAACESEMSGEILNGECSKLSHSPEERKLENTTGSSKLSLLHNMEDKLNISGTSHCIYDRPLRSSNSAPDMKSLFVATPTSSENLVESASAPKVNCPLYSALNSANKIEIISDAKSSSVATANSSGNPEKTIGCSQNTVVQTKRANVTPRLHWDLNVAMEAWDTDCGDVDDPLVATVSDHDGAKNDMNKPGTSHHFELRDGSLPGHSVDKIHMADALKHVSANTKHTCDCPADVSSDPSQDLPLLESGSVGNDALAETMNLPDQQNSRLASVMDLHIRSDPEPALIMEHFASAANVEKIEGSHPHPVHSEGLSNMSSMNVCVGSNSLQTSELGTTLKPLDSRLVSEESTNLPTAVMDLHIRSNPEPALIMEHFASAANVEKIDGSFPHPVHSEGLSNMSSMNVHIGSNVLQTSELSTRVKPLASRLVSEESTNLPTVGTFHKKVTDFGWSDNKLEEASEQSISESKNQELLDVDSGTSKKGEHDTDIFNANKRTKDAENLTHSEDNHGSYDCDVAHVQEEDGAVAMINSKDSLVTCANSSTVETYYMSDVAPQVPGPSSECHKPAFVTDLGSIANSKAAIHSYQNGCENEFGKVVSNVCLDQYCETDTSHISKNLAGIEKVDVEEDDSQYEDGELRESGDCYWVGDGYEVKHANWHYQVSDYKNEEANTSLTPLHADSVAKNVVIPVANYNGTQSRKEDGAVSHVSSKHSWLTNCLHGGPISDGKAQNINLRGDTKMYGSNPGRVAVGSATTVSQLERCNDALSDDDMLNIRMKSTGWDMMPEDQKHSQNDATDVTDLSNRCVLSSDAARDDESLHKKVLSNRDLVGLKRQKSFDRPQRNELSRSDDGYGSGSKSERTMDSHRSHGMYGASRHVQTSGRGDWLENSKHPRSTRHKSPEYYNYGPSGPRNDPSGPRNAAEAAVAKMESSGFVVARDGTLVRAVDAANAGQMPRRMRNTLSSSGRLISCRGSPIDRDGACGMSRGPMHAREASPERHFDANSNRSSRYGPEMEKDHTNGNLNSVRCSLSSRQRGTPTSHAHSRSPSGSRSRSPHDWAPRNRSKIMANGGSTLRRHSRSPPNHMAKGRICRMASPQRQPGYDDRAMRYSPLSRNNTYSQHASTWADRRNSSAVDISDDHNKRYSRRSPPLRIPARNDRFDVMGSQERPRSGEFYRPAQGRLLYGYDRENKHDRNGEDEREYTDRYANHSVKPYDRSGAAKQFRNNTGDKFRTRISTPRSPELQRRVSPRRFDRSFER